VVDGALNQKPIVSKVFVSFLIVLLLAGIGGGAYAFTRPEKAGQGTLGELGAPPKPKRFTAVATASDKIKLSWQAISQISEYLVQVIDPADKNSVINVISGIDSSQTAVVVPGDGPEKINCYRLQALRDKKMGPASDVACTTTLKPTTGSTLTQTPTPTPTPTPSASTSTSESPGGGSTASPSPRPTVVKGQWVVVANYWPVRTTPKAFADDRVSQLRAKGLPAQVLDTQNYPNFRFSQTRPPAERLWLVTAGPFRSAEEATAACPTVHKVPSTSTSCIVVQPDPQ
jgi:hypothetical protein